MATKKETAQEKLELSMNPAYNVGRSHARIHRENMSRIKAMVFVPDDRAHFPNWSWKKVTAGLIVIFLGGQIAYGLLAFFGV